jgi:hypothetical protein
MNVFKIIPSTYLNAAGLGGKEIRDTISRVSAVEFDRGESKLVVALDKDGRGVILNRTNLETIVAAYGPETDDWVGKPVVVRAEPTTFQGRKIQGIRVHIPPAAGSNRSGASNPFAATNTSDDDGIPFTFN